MRFSMSILYFVFYNNFQIYLYGNSGFRKEYDFPLNIDQIFVDFKNVFYFIFIYFINCGILLY